MTLYCGREISLDRRGRFLLNLPTRFYRSSPGPSTPSHRLFGDNTWSYRSDKPERSDMNSNATTHSFRPMMALMAQLYWDEP